MSPERWQQIQEILDLTLGTAPKRRQAILDEACAGDSSLRRDVESFLVHEDKLDGFIENPLWDARRAAAAAQCGRRIGRYRLERLLGRGGMGEVYLAVRIDDFEKRVALKVIHGDVERIGARLRSERQILARLDHPSIARILDAGTTEEGRPYLVMEYVEGEPLDRYCTTHGLSVRERLALFRQVCAAVAAAHRQLVVHRDLKPSNILVTADGVPKLLDFGIAKLLDSESAPAVTDVGGSGPMTPAWASPEQLCGDPITTVSDVYALGMVLYHLLAGRHPYRLESGNWTQMVGRICAKPPLPPSAVADRGRPLAGDLDAIVLKAMRIEPEHRYGSVEQLSEDLRRHLVGLPVRARRGNWAYRIGKLVRRHKLALVMVLLILAFSATTSVLAWRAERERAEAVREQSRAESVSQFLEELFEGTAATPAGERTVSVRQILDRGRERIADLKALPEVRAELAGTLGTVYTNLGLYEEGRELLEEAVQSRRAHRGEDHTELAVDVNNLGKLLYNVGDYDGAERCFREALAMRRRLGQEDAELAVPMANLASILNYRGAYEEAEPLYRQLLAIREEAYGSDDPRVASILYNLGTLHYLRCESDEAEPLLRRALAIRIRAHGERNTQVATVKNSLGRVLFARGRLDEAAQLYDEALAVRRELLGEDHPNVALTRRDLAELLLARGETAAAGEVLAAALAVLRRIKPAGDFCLASTESVFGTWLVALGRYEEAEPYLVASHRIIREIKGERSIYTRHAQRRIDDLYQAWDRPGSDHQLYWHPGTQGDVDADFQSDVQVP